MTNVLSQRRTSLVFILVLALWFTMGWSPSGFAQTADLDQCRNGSATSPSNCVDNGNTGWVNGNAGASSAHYLETHSIPYRVVMTGLPTGQTITLTIGYDIIHSGKHAIDFLTHYNRLEPHGQFGHVAESVDPTSGVAVTSAVTTEFDIPAPSSISPCISPNVGQPTATFNALPIAERKMTLFGGTITAISYGSEGCLTASQAETRIAVSFTVPVNNATAVLAFGGHIASGGTWSGDSASAISGSPYHMRLVNWTLGSLGNQDRSLSASAVIDPCDGVSCSADVCETAVCVNGLCIPTPKSTDTLCRESAGVCDAADYCDGENGFCPDTKQPQGTVCRATAGVCDVAEVCDGTSNSCPADGFASNTTECRPSAGVCDVAEMCTGKSAACPSDQFASSNTVCRNGSGDICDPEEKCTGNSAICPVDQVAATNVVCRTGSGDSCDPAEYCTGIAGQACPADVVTSANTVCRTGSGDICDPDEKCTGIAGQACPANTVASKSTICRAGSGDSCDPAEYCTGQAGQACPANAYASASTVCRAATGVCDVAEYCPGTPGGSCPGDGVKIAGTVCRDSAGVCDVLERCDGSSGYCPGDTFKAAGIECRPAFGFCDVAESCTGTGPNCPADVFVSANTLCRPGDGICNPDEFCTGNSGLCPNDQIFDPRNETCQALQVQVCRTPGFWGTHAGTDKKSPKVKNITLAVIDAADGILGNGGTLNICGEQIINTNLDDAASALEAMCVPIQGDQRLQLARQLTAASLNCIVSGALADCSLPTAGNFGPVFAACNTACSDSTSVYYGGCIAALACLNQGGNLDLNTGFCQTGTCSDTPWEPCNDGDLSRCADPNTAICQPLVGTCHDQALCLQGAPGVCFNETGPAGSSQTCNDANNNKCTIVGPGEYDCKVDSAS